MAVNPSPFSPKPQFFDQAGDPDVSYKLFAYVAGSTSTKLDTFTDSTGTVANTNPVILNALGQTPNEYWFTEGQGYKIVLAPFTDTDPPTNPIWTIDNLYGINDPINSPAQDEWVVSPLVPTFVSGTSFTVPGNQTLLFQIQRRVRTQNTAGLVYGTITNSSFGGGVTTVTVANDSGALDSGLSQVSYGLLSVTNPSVPATYAKSGANSDITSTSALAAMTNLATINGANVVYEQFRQNVLSGPVDTNGYSAFGGSTGTTTVTATGTLIATAANGWVTGGQQNRRGSITNPAWTGLSTNGTMYLCLDVNADGTCTTGSTTLVPVYQWGGTYSTTTNQFTFNVQEMVGKVGNGATAAQTYRVYVGEVTVAVGVVTAITWYALQARYDSGLFAVTTGTNYSKNHNLGVIPKSVQVFVADDTAGLNERQLFGFYNNSGSQVGGYPSSGATRTSLQYFTGTAGVSLSVGGGLLTPGAYRYIVQRGW